MHDWSKISDISVLDDHKALKNLEFEVSRVVFRARKILVYNEFCKKFG